MTSNSKIPDDPVREPASNSAFFVILHHKVTAWVILVISLIFTAAAWHISNHFVQERAADRFAFQSADLRQGIAKRMLEYELMLRGATALFAASRDVTRSEWRTYVEHLEIDRYFPGVQGIGFAEVIPSSARMAHTARIQAEGFPEYALYPEGERDAYTSIVYLEPFSGRNLRAFGYDMFSEPVRRQAMERARDSGEPALSGMVTLVQENGIDLQRGFLMYLPVYRSGMPIDDREQRRAALTGYVYSPFRIRDLLRGILGPRISDIDFEIYDSDTPSPDTLLYASPEPLSLLSRGTEPNPVAFSNRDTLMVAGRIWTLAVYAGPGYVTAADSNQSTLIAFGGILIDLLLFFIIASISRQQQQALALARLMTTEVRQSQAQLADKACALEQTNRDLERFTEVLAHHIQEPVRMQYVFAQRLERMVPETLPEDARRSLEYVQKGALRLRILIHDVLLYLALKPVPLSAAHGSAQVACAAACKRLESKIAASGAVIACDPLPRVRLSEARLADVFTALLDNALKYHHPERKPLIRIAAHLQTDHILFTITDNGIGIGEAFRTRVFGVFERLFPEHRHPGTGIGLAMVKRILDQAGGSVWLEDGSEGGLRVCFLLPADAERGAA